MHLTASKNCKIRRIMQHDDDIEASNSSYASTANAAQGIIRMMRAGLMKEERDGSGSVAGASSSLSNLQLSSQKPTHNGTSKPASTESEANLPARRKRIDPGIWLQVCLYLGSFRPCY